MKLLRQLLLYSLHLLQSLNKKPSVLRKQNRTWWVSKRKNVCLKHGIHSLVCEGLNPSLLRWSSTRAKSTLRAVSACSEWSNFGISPGISFSSLSSLLLWKLEKNYMSFSSWLQGQRCFHPSQTFGRIPSRLSKLGKRFSFKASTLTSSLISFILAWFYIASHWFHRFCFHFNAFYCFNKITHQRRQQVQG